MKALSTAELQQHSALPMTKAQKLERFADLISQHGSPLMLYHLLERLSMHDKNGIRAGEHNSAFSIAVRDPVFQAGGIGETVGSVQRYLELSDYELHEFSCDCGGAISNEDQARRVRDIAARS